MTENKTSATQPAIDDAHWLAMQYVLGELSDERTELFESAMADDVALCEAVLSATRLSAGLASAYESRQSVQLTIASAMVVESLVSRSRPAFAQFCVFAATTAMALAVLATVTHHYSPRSVDVASNDDATADALAMLLDNSSASDSTIEFDEWSVSDDSDSSLVAPEWLLTAVDLDAAGSQDIPAIGPDDESRVY